MESHQNQMAVNLSSRQVSLLRRSVFVLKRRIQAEKPNDTATLGELNAMDQLLTNIQAERELVGQS